MIIRVIKNIFFIATMVLAVSPSGTTLTGIIIDRNGAPIAGAACKLLANRSFCRTDSLGQYSLTVTGETARRISSPAISISSRGALIQITTIDAVPITAEIFSLNGRKIPTKQFLLSSETTLLGFENTSPASGLYLLRGRLGSTVFSSRMTILDGRITIPSFPESFSSAGSVIACDTILINKEGLLPKKVPISESVQNMGKIVVDSPATGKRINYVVTIPSMPADSITVSTTISGTRNRMSLVALPPVYSDNPMRISTTHTIGHITCFDGTTELSYIIDTLRLGPQTSVLLRLPKTESDSIVCSYTVHIPFDTNNVYKDMPLCHVGSTEGYLSGAFLFGIPIDTTLCLGELWRETRTISVLWNIPAGSTILGDPLEHSYANIYEALFTQSAIIASSSSREMAKDSTAGQVFSVVDISADHSLSQGIVSWIDTSFRKELVWLVPRFGKFDKPFTLITGMGGGLGLEGMYAFAYTSPRDNNHEMDAIVQTHELIHSWVGVRCGETDLAWWKEATAEYFGCTVSSICGQISDATLQFQLMPPWVATDTAVTQRALSDPRTREMLYGGWSNLVYFKGGQVCMLMDRAIRKSSVNRITLLDCTAQITSLWAGRAFSRAELLDFILKESGADLSSLFNDYVDKSGPIPADVLTNCFEELKGEGAFSATVF